MDIDASAMPLTGPILPYLPQPSHSLSCDPRCSPGRRLWQRPLPGAGTAPYPGAPPGMAVSEVRGSPSGASTHPQQRHSEPQTVRLGMEGQVHDIGPQKMMGLPLVLAATAVRSLRNVGHSPKLTEDFPLVLLSHPLRLAGAMLNRVLLVVPFCTSVAGHHQPTTATYFRPSTTSTCTAAPYHSSASTTAAKYRSSDCTAAAAGSCNAPDGHCRCWSPKSTNALPEPQYGVASGPTTTIPQPASSRPQCVRRPDHGTAASPHIFQGRGFRLQYVQ
ncbi:hypothetical protein FA13DRAFT_305360 [Coprinellus micaceus]|uniref:Uncharacterized protein n=1 Tax=Coprinellus micaceus TaxID=71717 RepID=A0A4Y7SDP6_COPMI|nr:hypothetical protein FA13DRAFT_305360 [Coprinellus micaceus]